MRPNWPRVLLVLAVVPVVCGLVWGALALRSGATKTPLPLDDQCEAGVSVTLCTIEGMGHCWPGQPICPFGQANTDLKANAELWAFFGQYSLP